MSKTELAFIADFTKLLNKYHATLVTYENYRKPEMGFITNFESLKVYGVDLDLDLYDLQQKLFLHAL